MQALLWYLSLSIHLHEQYLLNWNTHFIKTASFHLDCTHASFLGTLISIHFSFDNLKFLGHLICKKELGCQKRKITIRKLIHESHLKTEELINQLAMQQNQPAELEEVGTKCLIKFTPWVVRATSDKKKFTGSRKDASHTKKTRSSFRIKLYS